MAARVNDYQKKMVKFLVNEGIIEDNQLVIMAPTKGKKGFNGVRFNGVRVYANGGLLAHIMPSKTNYLSDHGYDKFIKEVTKKNREEFFDKNDYSTKSTDDLDKEGYSNFLKTCVDVTKKWSNDDEQTHDERVKETEIIYCWRKNDCGMTFIDMEFNLDPWKGIWKDASFYGKCTNDKGSEKLKTRGGRVDLVVYDKIKGFGLIELKFDCKSMENLGKHFADFEAALHNNQKGEIIKELVDRMKTLEELLDCINPPESIIEKLWYGFLLIGSSEEEYKIAFNNVDYWKCKEQKDGEKYTVDWTELKKAYELGKKNDAVIYWASSVNEINEAKPMTYCDFIKSVE